MSEHDAQRDRQWNGTFVVTYLPDSDNPFCQLVLHMPGQAFVSDMIAQLPYFINCQERVVQEPSSFVMFSDACRVFAAHSEYIGSHQQMIDQSLSREKAHAQLMQEVWSRTPAQDIIIIWRSNDMTDPVQLYMRHALRAPDAQARPVIAATGDSTGFAATRSQLHDMSRRLRTLQ